MKKISIFRRLLLATMICASATVSAQVTIGSGKVPESFSVLELISNQAQGLRLPQMTIAQRNTLQASFGTLATTEAMGLQIFNTNTRCIETWNGGSWISICGSVDSPSIDPILCGTPPAPVSVPVFMAYNLGADPTLDTPKKQMSYLANTGTVSTPTNNGRVYGGRYQWGRANLPYAISTDGNYTLYDGDTNSVNLNTLIPASYSSSGQIVGQDNNHVYPNPSIFDTYDWRTGESSPVQQDNLWDSNGGTQAGSFSPSKSINDPCPSGWRVPTQDEWERLGNYDCDHTVAGGAVNLTDGIGQTDNNFTWVAVVCSGGVCSQNVTWGIDNSNSGVNSGYAIYRSDVWNDDSWDKTNLLDSSDPEPFLFLPAAGSRDFSSGQMTSVGTDGNYWSSTVDGVFARYLYFGNNYVYPFAASYRSYGISVRCVAD